MLVTKTEVVVKEKWKIEMKEKIKKMATWGPDGDSDNGDTP